MADLWMRKCSFNCGGTFESPLTIKFRVPFSDDENTNDAEIEVYNLKNSSFAAQATAILQAGYRDSSGVIFTGELREAKTKWQGADKVTTFICTDAPANYLQKDFKKNYAKGTPASVIITEIAGFAGIGIGDLSLPVNFIYRTGKTVNGKPKTLLTALAKDCKAKMHVTQGRLYMRDKNKGTQMGLNISKETGLLDNPEVITNEIENAQTKKKVVRIGYKIKMLLNHNITTDVIINLSSKTASGTFRVEKGEHTGDTSSNEWFTVCEVFPL